MSTSWLRCDHGWSLNGVPAVLLTNAHLQVVVLPTLGGKVWQIRHLATGTDLLWQHPRLPLKAAVFGASYDDHFLGGWDELFPNDLPETLGDEPFPDHGEAWASAWRVTASGPGSVTLDLHAPVSACRLTKTVRLRPGEAALDVDISIANDTAADLPMLHKQHLAAAVVPGSRVDRPSGEILIGDFGRPRAGRPGVTFAWPRLDGEDFRPVPDRSRRVSELLFGVQPGGWCAVTRPDGLGIGLAYDAGAYPSCWTFATHGGWRDLDVVVLEPCTGRGLSVVDGVAAGSHRVLRAGERFETSLTAVVYAGLREVTHITAEASGCRVEGVPT